MNLEKEAAAETARVINVRTVPKFSHIPNESSQIKIILKALFTHSILQDVFVSLASENGHLNKIRNSSQSSF
jgi:hypothetical protein